MTYPNKGDLHFNLTAQYLPPSGGGGPNRVKLSLTVWRTSTNELAQLSDLDGSTIGSEIVIDLWVETGSGNAGFDIAQFTDADFYTPTGGHADEVLVAAKDTAGGSGQDTVYATVQLTYDDGVSGPVPHQETVHIPWSF